MKRIILTIALFMLIGCADNKVIDGKEYETYGLINKKDIKDSTIHYSLSKGNVVWGILLSETLVAPLYFFGFSLWQPECKINNGIKVTEE